jgi:hypothetical protein
VTVGADDELADAVRAIEHTGRRDRREALVRVVVSKYPAAPGTGDLGAAARDFVAVV